MLKKGCPSCVQEPQVLSQCTPHWGALGHFFSDSLNCKYLQMYSGSTGFSMFREPQSRYYIDDRLSFDYHIEHIIGKAARQLKRFFHVLDIGAYLAKCRSCVRAFITSNFDMCCILWHYCNERMSKSFEKLQTREL